MHYDIPNYRRPVAFESTPIVRASELFFALEEPGWPQTIAISNIFHGPCDVEAMRASLVDACATQPVFTSLIATIGRSPRQQFVWRHSGQPVDVEVVDRSSGPAPQGDYHEWLPAIDIDREVFAPDTTVEFPVKFRITKLATDLHVLSAWLHHAIGDGSTFLMFALDFLGRYHERVTGEVPEWMSLATMHSAIAPDSDIDVISAREFAKEAWRTERAFPRDEVPFIVGTPGEALPISVTRAPEDQSVIADLRARARTAGGSLTDVAVAAATRVIAQWNEERGAPAADQSHAVVVNLRGRMPELNAAGAQNELGLLEINVRQTDMDDPEALLRAVAGQRSSKLERGFDVASSQVFGRAHTALKGIGAQRRLATMRAAWRAHTLNVSNMGVVFPEVVDGQVTGGFGLPEVGGLQIGGAVIRSNTMPTTPNTLTLSQGAQGFRLVLSGNQQHTTQAELAMLGDRLIAAMVDFA